jgi:Tfp pilus assembly protein FimT
LWNLLFLSAAGEKSLTVIVLRWGLILRAFRADNGDVETQTHISHDRRRAAGVTLVELTVLIVILGVVANIAIPLMGSVASSQLRSASELLAADLAYAQIESIAHSDDPRVLVLEADGSGYSIAAVSDTTAPVTNPVGGGDYKVTFGIGRAGRMVGVSINATDIGDDDELGFGQYGQLDQDLDATLTVQLNDRSVGLTIEADTGEVTVSEIQ